jgi:hypothetical protein
MFCEDHIHSALCVPAPCSANILASVCFTVISTLFNLHAMREGVLVVGENGGSTASDMRSLPKTIFTFVTSGFRLFGF